MQKSSLFKIALVFLGAIIPVAVFAIVVRATVVSRTPTNVTENSATLNGEVTDDGGCLELKLWFEYGPTASYGLKTKVEERNEIGTFSAAITGLAPCTMYHFRAVAENNGKRPGYGRDTMFNTRCAVLPVVVPSIPPTTPTPPTIIYPTQVGTAAKSGVLNSILLPLLIAFFAVWIFRSKLFSLDKWASERKMAVGEYRARKELARRVKKARQD